MNIFLSHSSKDAGLARRLALDLKAANIEVWLDQWQLGVGEDIEQSIERGIDESDFVIVLLTHASMASNWVEREWRQKIHNEAQTERISIVPVRGETCEIPDFLAHRSYADLSGGSYHLGLSHLLEILRYHSNKSVSDSPNTVTVQNHVASEPDPEGMPPLLPVMTPISLEVGTDLIPLFESDDAGNNRVIDYLFPWLRTALEAELGFRFPGIRVRGNESDMPPDAGLIMIDETPECMFTLGHENALVAATVDQLAAIGIEGEPGQHPITGQTWTWITGATNYATVQAAGFAFLDAAEYITLFLKATLKRMAALFVDIDTTQRLVNTVADTAPELVAKATQTFAWIDLTYVLQSLVEDGIGVGNMERILAFLVHAAPDQHDPFVLTELARQALSAEITAQVAPDQTSLSVWQLSPDIEDRVSRAIQYTPNGQYIDLEPDLCQNILTAVRKQVQTAGPGAASMPIVTRAQIRRYLQKLVSLEFPALRVLSNQELEPDLHLQVVATIQLDGVTNESELLAGGQTA